MLRRGRSGSGSTGLGLDIVHHAVERPDRPDVHHPDVHHLDIHLRSHHQPGTGDGD